MTDRIVTGEIREEDPPSEGGLRPRSLSEYIGQEKVKENLTIGMSAARKRGEPLDHVLLYGPPGLGKTTLASIIAGEMGASLRTTAGPAIERPGDMASMLTQLKSGDVLFIDEIHRLGKVVEEILYPAMEDYSLSWVMGKGLNAQSMTLKVEFAKALSHAALGQDAQARALLNGVIDSGDEVLARNAQLQMISMAEKQDPQEAVRTYEGMLSHLDTQEDRVRVLIRLASAYFRLGQYDHSVEASKQLLDIAVDADDIAPRQHKVPQHDGQISRAATDIDPAHPGFHASH